MTISKNEFNTITKTVEIWNYHLTESGNSIISSERIMYFPVPEWANRFDINNAQLILALRTNRWRRGDE